MSTNTSRVSRAGFLIAGVAVVLGMAMVFKEPVARAAAELINAHITNLDANGYVAVHEQGTAKVRVTNPSLLVQPHAAAPWRNITHLTAPQLGYSSPLRPIAGPHAGPIAVTHLTLSPLISRSITPTDVHLEAWVEDAPACTERAYGDGSNRIWAVHVHNPDGPAQILVVPFPVPLETAAPPSGSRLCLGAQLNGFAGWGIDVSASGFYGK